MTMGARCFIVGDIHACPKELDALLTALHLQAEDHVIFLGDYIDRGPDARAVVDLLLGMKADEVCQLTFLKGNHEDMFLDFLGLPGRYGEAFLVNGGVQTLGSYGVPRWLAGQEAADHLPPPHLDFYQALEIMHIHSDTLGDTLCVHAGVNPFRPFAEQTEEERLWIRQEFILQTHNFPYTVVFGHTPQREVFFDLPYKVGIDTGLVYGGKLSCLEITEHKLFQIAKGSRQVQMKSVLPYWERQKQASL